MREIKENFLMLNKMKTAHSMFIQLLKSQMNLVLSFLYTQQEGKLPCENEANPRNEK